MAPEDDDSTTPTEVTEPVEGSADGPRPALSELRAKDLLALPREQVEAELDPQTMAELASWFLRPSRVAVDEAALAAAGARGSADQASVEAFERLALSMGFPGDSDDERRERLEARATAMAAVQPAMLALFDRHEQRAKTILPIRLEPRQWIDETILPASILSMVPSEDQPLPAFGEPRVLERADDIEKLLSDDNAPQAVLRDLRRLVEDFERKLVPAFPPPSESEDMRFAIRDALRWRPEPVPPREPIPDVRDAWRPYLAAVWADLVKTGKELRQREVEEAAANDTGGYYFNS